MAVLATVGSCGGEDPFEVEFEVIEELTFAPSLGVDLGAMDSLPNGLYVQDRVVGTGDTVAVGSSVVVSYTGWLANGVQFDAGTLDFVVGDGQLIEGFDQGVRGMLGGGTRLVIIPPLLAYGAQARGQIPAGAVLVFEITMDQVTNDP